MQRKLPYFDSKMSNEDYQKHPALSKSGLDDFMRSPEHYKTYWNGEAREEEKKTKALDLGSALHCAILEPIRFADEYIPYPKFDRRTAEGKKKWDQIRKKAERKRATLIEEDRYKVCLYISKSFDNHPIARELLYGEGYTETSFFWRDKETGVECRCRPDKVNIERGVILDIKSAREVLEHGFQKSIYDYKYYLQVPHYSAGVTEVLGMEVKGFVFAAWEKTPPYGLKLYCLGPVTLKASYVIHRALLRSYALCRAKNDWPGYDTSITPIELPNYALRHLGFTDFFAEDNLRELSPKVISLY